MLFIRVCRESPATPRSSRNKVRWQMGQVKQETDWGRAGIFTPVGVVALTLCWGAVPDPRDWKELTSRETLEPKTGGEDDSLCTASGFSRSPVLPDEPAEYPLSESLNTASLITLALSASTDGL